MTTDTPALSGRRAQAAQNDKAILDAARTTLMRLPSAPMSAVAKEAGVGISALYHRYASKEELLQTLCAEGLNEFISIVEAALADHGEPWDAFESCMRQIIEADVHSLTVRLAGTFTPTDELHSLAGRANKLMGRLFSRTKAAKAIRSDVQLNDLAMILEQITAVRVNDPQRTNALRLRYLTLILDGVRPAAGLVKLPGPAPTSSEIGERWTPAHRA